MKHTVEIISVKQITHDVKKFRLTKPAGYRFNPGQATELSINRPEWANVLRPFTFTSLNSENFLEFTIKIYPDHHGMTEQLDKLGKGDELIINDSWGAIEYKGPGYFIAGGAGITPFLAILKQLHQFGQLNGNTLFFANKSKGDIILEDDLKDMLCSKVTFLISGKTEDLYLNERIGYAFLKENVNDPKQYFYICGPEQMVNDVNDILLSMGVSPDRLVYEK
ncbi:flavodoxin reductase [Mucilaginibacter daejeonensis]|uniref:FAD-binding oxidoreductase n=1 Tax=Mucilaginibacter daejeonensis TaxID=398049 RepID=UPI001D179519|nr:FAD-binding oxidoreductase [Mucilaginibacter daejeonensis]UEG51871.1 flavodoxin reductase [Mucilaginibacter daejeonensis]